MRNHSESTDRPTAIVTSHPIQYQAPVYQSLARRLPIHVYFGELVDAATQGEGFGKAFEWDIPLTEGYPWSNLGGKGAPKTQGLLYYFHKIRRQWITSRPRAAVIQGWYHPCLRAALMVCHLLGIPSLFRGDNNLLMRRPALALLMHSLLLSRCSRVLAVGQSNRRYYEFLGVAPQKVVDCPHSSDTDRLASQVDSLQPRVHHLRQEWGIPNDRTVFLFCGKLEKKKRPQDLINASGSVPQSHVLIVGSGELESELRKASSEHTSFAGFLNQSEIARAYAAGDVLVLPSDAGETWGLVVNEAMACGLPAIVSDQVGCREDLVREGITGYSYPCGDTDALADRMRRFIMDPAARTRMGQSARKLISSSYSVEAAAAGIEKAVRSLAS